MKKLLSFVVRVVTPAIFILLVPVVGVDANLRRQAAMHAVDLVSQVILSPMAFAESEPGQASATKAPTITPAPELDIKSSVLKMIQGLALCVGLLFLLVWIQKRSQGSRGGSKGNKSLAIIERLQTGPKTQVLLVSVKGREYLVGQGSDSVNIYGEVVHEELEPDTASPLKEVLP